MWNFNPLGQTENSPLLNDTESPHQADDGENEIQGNNQETVVSFVSPNSDFSNFLMYSNETQSVLLK